VQFEDYFFDVVGYVAVSWARDADGPLVGVHVGDIARGGFETCQGGGVVAVHDGTVDGHALELMGVYTRGKRTFRRLCAGVILM
jgi:hypothetical protein